METLQPKLRFPEFKESLVKYKLSEKMNVFRGASPRPQGDPRFYGGDVPRLMIQDATRDGKYVYPKIDFLTELGSEKSRFLKKGSVVLSCSGTVVAIPTILGVDACIHDGWLGFNEFKDVNNEFLYYNFVKLHEIMQGSATTGGVFNNLTTSILKDYEIYFPNFQEQTKIANFHSSVDEKLNLLKDKKSLLEDYKKGIMQKIFNQEIRFKDDNGNDFEDWIETNLGGICEFENGKAHENEIDENGDFIVVNSKFVSTNGRVRKYTNKIISRLDKYDIVMVMSDVPNGKAIAKCYYIEEDNKYSLNQRICKIRIVNNDSKYIYYLINRNPYYLAFDSGVGQTNLRKDEVLDCPLYIPKDIKEQTKIANFLSAIDEKIELVSNQIQDTQEYKKGLLQQMFV